MASVNPHTRELVFKLVFYGPGLGGKTTTLQYIHAATKPEHRGKMVSLATPTDRTLYFDFLPIRVPRVRGMAVRLQLALHLQDDVDEMLECPRSRDGAVLGHVADDDRGHAPRLGDLDQRGRHLLDLRHPAGCAIDVGTADRLHRVDDEQAGVDLLDVPQHCREVGLGRQVQLRRDRADPFAPQPYLRSRLLTGDVEGGMGRAGRARRDLEQQRRLADAGLPCQQDDRAGHQPTAEDPVELVDPGRPGCRGGGRDLSDRHGRCSDRAGDDLTQPWRTDRFDSSPCLALAAAALPLDRRPAALAAPV
jgi:hypothetical protein